MTTRLITGGARLIGACLAEKLLARGERVVRFDWAPAGWRIGHLAGVRRKFVPLEVGLRAHIEVARARARRESAGEGGDEP